MKAMYINNSRRALRSRVFALAAIFIMTLIIILCGSIRAFASSTSSSAELHKYYTSIQIEKGDSLWSIADDYITDGVISREDFISEVCSLNNISEDDTLRSGDHLVVVYYSDEDK